MCISYLGRWFREIVESWLRNPEFFCYSVLYLVFLIFTIAPLLQKHAANNYLIVRRRMAVRVCIKTKETAITARVFEMGQFLWTTPEQNSLGRSCFCLQLKQGGTRTCIIQLVLSSHGAFPLQKTKNKIWTIFARYRFLDGERFNRSTLDGGRLWNFLWYSGVFMLPRFCGPQVKGVRECF